MKTLILCTITIIIVACNSSAKDKSKALDTLTVSNTPVKKEVYRHKEYVETIFFIDSINSVKVKTKYISEHQVEQELFFMRDTVILKAIKTSSIDAFNINNKRYSYLLTDICQGVIEKKNIYVISSYVANGNPEIYLYFNSIGDLLFSRKCTRDSCVTNLYSKNINNEKVQKFISDTSQFKKCNEIDGIFK